MRQMVISGRVPLETPPCLATDRFDPSTNVSYLHTGNEERTVRSRPQSRPS